MESRTVYLKGSLRDCCEASLSHGSLSQYLFLLPPSSSSSFSLSKEGKDQGVKEEKEEETEEADKGETEEVCSGLYVEWYKVEDLWNALHAEILTWEIDRVGAIHRSSLLHDEPYVSEETFAKLLVCFVEPSQMEGISKRPPLDGVSLQSIWMFEKFCREPDQLRFALEFASSLEDADNRKECLVTPQTLETALHALASIDDADNKENSRRIDFKPIVDVIFKVFDVDASGTLEEDEFIQLLSHR
ncbi:hypothetical protein CSUI_007898 [Cystoisospora suis]|uniref:EF-hand domain-containing protein n=1 Tax=Cystoisospora suis TaxID=483139 RepID=A0A2C6KP32_9APIC|nr:hypothetical protein CSUI_007898 [Cystoisospora suis]